jgi:hypothetical protein
LVVVLQLVLGVVQGLTVQSGVQVRVVVLQRPLLSEHTVTLPLPSSLGIETVLGRIAHGALPSCSAQRPTPPPMSMQTSVGGAAGHGELAEQGVFQPLAPGLHSASVLSQ